MTTPTDTGPELSLKAAFDIGLDLSTKIERTNRFLQRLQRVADCRPNKYTTRANGTAGASGVVVLDLGKPSLGREWIVRHWSVFDPTNTSLNATSTPANAGTPTVVSGTFAAGAAGSASLPAGASMTGFTVTSGAPATPPVATTVTVNGLVGSNQVFNFEETANGGLLQENFPTPLGPFLPSSTPTVTVAAATGGAAGNITVYGLTGVTAATTAGFTGTAGLYTGSPDAYNTSNAEDWNSGNSLPFFERMTSESIWVIPQDHLFVVVTGLTNGQQVAAKARVLDLDPNMAAQVQEV